MVALKKSTSTSTSTSTNSNNSSCGSSRSDLDWREAKEAKAHARPSHSFAGFIFVCNDSTISELDRHIFGLPAKYEESVKAIREGMPLFLYNYSTRLLHGVFEAASNGGYNLDPVAWESTLYGRAVSRYPAQVRVRVRKLGLPLEEEKFRPIVGHEEYHRFRLELALHQVQQLLQLFEVSCAQVEEMRAQERNHGSNFSYALQSQDSEPPDFTCKKDSDTLSDSSGGGTSAEEWMDEPYSVVNVRRGGGGRSLYRSPSHESLEDTLNQQMDQLALKEIQCNGDALFEKKFVNHVGTLGYHAHYVRVPDIAEENGIFPNFERLEHDELKSPKKQALRSRSGSPIRPENSMQIRLQEVDPAVNSTSMYGAQSCGQLSWDLTREEPLGRATLPHSLAQQQQQHHMMNSENLVFLPVSAMQNVSVEPQRRRYSEQRKYFQGWSGRNSLKHWAKQDKFNSNNNHHHNNNNNRQDVGVGFRKQEYHQQQAFTGQNIQQGQMFVPVRRPRAATFHEQGQMSTLLSQVVLPPPNGRNLPFSHTQGDGLEIYDASNECRLMQDGLQNVLPPGLWNLQPPGLIMPPMVQRVPESVHPVAKVDIAALHREIVEFAKLTRPSLDSQRQAEAAIVLIRRGVKRIWPEADVEVFGSFSTGLCLRHSDVDLAVVGAPLPQTEFLSVAKASSSLIRELAAALQNYEWCESINVLDTASMPVLKCHCRPSFMQTALSILPSLAIDITIGAMRNAEQEVPENLPLDPAVKIGKLRTKHTGGMARDYVLQKICDLPALAPLALLLKSYLHHKGLSNVYLGGLGSFSLTLLLTYYLECIPTPLNIPADFLSSIDASVSSSSPDFSEDSDSSSSSSCDRIYSEEAGEPLLKRAASVVDKVLTLWCSVGSPFLGTLLLGFLQTFGFEYDLATVKVILRGLDGTPGGIVRRDISSRHIALWIDDPLRPGVNIGAGSFGMFHVQAAFREMLEVLTNRKICIPASLNSGSLCRDIPIEWLYMNRIFVDADEH